MILNNKILILLQKAPIETRITQLYTNFNTMPSPDLHKFQILKFVHKFIHHQDQLPSIYYLCDALSAVIATATWLGGCHTPVLYQNG